MALLVVMLPAGANARLHPDAVTDLARLGVTSLAAVRDDRSGGVVVEGWGSIPSAQATACCPPSADPAPGLARFVP
jgi:hypothetical protein